MIKSISENVGLLPAVTQAVCAAPTASPDAADPGPGGHAGFAQSETADSAGF